MQLVHILSNAGSGMFSLSQKTKAMTRRPLSAAIGGDVSHVATANESDVTLLICRCEAIMATWSAKRYGRASWC